MEIVPYEYYVDGSLDWLRVVRRIREAIDGSSIPRSRRLYVKSKMVIAVLPLDVRLYKDENGKLFVDEKDISNWDGFDEYERMFDKVSKNIK